MTATNKSLKLIEILDAEFQMAEGLIYLTVLKKRQERSSLWRIGRGGHEVIKFEFSFNSQMWAILHFTGTEGNYIDIYINN